MNPFFHTGLPLDATLTNLSPGFTYHCRAFASNELGAASSPDLAVSLPLLNRPGDLNGDGVVDQRDLDILLANLNKSGLDQNTLNLVLSNYRPHSPWLNMTNVAAWGVGGFQFALTNAGGWNFTVLASTNLVDWEPLAAPAWPVWQFTDPAATNYGRRFYRLRWP